MSKRPPRPIVRAWMIADDLLAHWPPLRAWLRANGHDEADIAAIEDQVQAVHRSMRELMAGE